MTTYAILRSELWKVGDKPPLIGQIEKPIDWKTVCFECWQPDDLDNEEFNLILKSDYFKNGYAMALSIDFSFYDNEEEK